MTTLTTPNHPYSDASRYINVLELTLFRLFVVVCMRQWFARVETLEVNIVSKNVVQGLDLALSLSYKRARNCNCEFKFKGKLNHT